MSPAGGSGASPSGRPSKSNKTAPGLALGKPFELVQQKDESMGTAFFHTTSNLLTLLSLSPPFDKEGGEMVGIRRIFFLVFSWTKRQAQAQASYVAGFPVPLPLPPGPPVRLD